MARVSEILKTKTVDQDKKIALVKWTSESNLDFVEYTTHCIYPQGCKGLHHGEYFETLAAAEANFLIRE